MSTFYGRGAEILRRSTAKKEKSRKNPKETMDCESDANTSSDSSDTYKSSKSKEY